MPCVPLMMLIGSIIFINMLLSGDNVLVIGTLLATISPDRRWLVLTLGGSGAVVLRIACTLFVASWLNTAWIQVIGGLLLLFIAIRLLRNQKQNVARPRPSMTRLQHFVKRHRVAQCLTQVSKRVMANRLSFAQKVQYPPNGSEKKSPPCSHPSLSRLPRLPNRFRDSALGGIVAIVLADSTTSVDNIIAIGAIGVTSGTNRLPLVLGLALSMTVVFLASTRLALLLHRLPWLTFVASLALAIRAGGLINVAVRSAFRISSTSPGHSFFSLQWLIYSACCFPVIFLELRYFLRKMDRKRQEEVDVGRVQRDKEINLL